ncbi:MAG: hypothetical protein HKN82_01675 [Akkermansiaceae bacterium]|nr:hypothetical protein [Akkermansiaceae bacterium]NNM28579.1 hypothetical protein [Akkermansiaceae bacterium]
MPPSPEEPAGKVIWLVWGVLGLTILGGVFTGAWESVFVGTLTLILTIVPVILPKRCGIHAPRSFVAAIVVFTFCTIFLGEHADLYERLWWWDIALHTGSALGIGLLGVSLMLVLQKRDRVRARPLLLSMFAFGFAVSIGVIWEIFEFGMDMMFGLNMQKSGLVDTMGDLIVDCLGATGASVVGYIYLKRKQKREPLGFLDEVLEEAVEENCRDGVTAPGAC